MVSSQSSTIGEFPDFDANKPLVLLLGNISHEGITSSLRAGGEQYKQKLLDSTVKNWESIVRIFTAFTVRAVVVKLNAAAYRRFADPEYQHVQAQLLKAISKVPHIVFVYNDLLAGEQSEQSKAKQEEYIRARVGDELDREDQFSYYELFGFQLPHEQILQTANEAFRTFQITLVPYKRNAEVTVMAVNFLREVLEDLLFKIYVPNGRLWASELDRLLQLFREYLLSIGRKGVRLDQSRTDRGVSYAFHAAEEGPAGQALADEFQEFAHVLDLSISDPTTAAAVLRGKNVDAREIDGILTRYAKEAKRLQVDLRHDRERKLLSIRQRLESELTEIVPDASWQELQVLVDRTIPSPLTIAAAYTIDSSQLPSYGQHSSLTINLSPQIIQQATGIVAREIRGDINLGPEDEHLLSLIERFGHKQSVELSSAVRELSDESIPQTERLTTAGKLKAFLHSLGPQVQSMGINILQAYIEQKIGLK